MQAPGLPRGFEITAKAVGGVPEPAPPAPQGAEGGGGLFSAICKAPSDNHFAFLHFFFFVIKTHKREFTLMLKLCPVPWGRGMG